jgi:hypothetical protein
MATQTAPGRPVIKPCNIANQITASSPLRSSRLIADVNLRLGVYADSQGVLICIGQCVHASDVLEDAIGLVGFF